MEWQNRSVKYGMNAAHRLDVLGKTGGGASAVAWRILSTLPAKKSLNWTAVTSWQIGDRKVNVVCYRSSHSKNRAASVDGDHGKLVAEISMRPRRTAATGQRAYKQQCRHVRAFWSVLGGTVLSVKPGVRRTRFTDTSSSGQQVVKDRRQHHIIQFSHVINIIRPGFRLAERRLGDSGSKFVNVQLTLRAS